MDLHAFSLKYSMANRRRRLPHVDPALTTHAGAQTRIFTVSSEALCARCSGRHERHRCTVVLMLGHPHQWQPTLVLHCFGICWWRVQTPWGGVCCEFSA